MSGIFGTNASLIADLSLIIQIGSFILVLISMVYEVKRKFKIHGFIMGAGIGLHFINFLVAMLPLFIARFNAFTSETFLVFVQTLWVHVVSGALVLVLGFFIIIKWVSKPSTIKGCFRRKRLMDATVLLWATSLAFGIATYVALYT